MEQIATLAPNIVWSIFSEILTIPRPSKHEEQIRAYLVSFAAKHNLECKTDEKGNVVIIRNAEKGFEKAPAIVLQSHMDMVCEKSADVKHDFFKDPINGYIKDGWVMAKGTTLGADCGIGMALGLATLIEPSLACAQIEALFTVDEEQGLSGAMELSNNILSGNYLLNLDSEDEGEIFIGCAGGVDTIAKFKMGSKKLTKNSIYKIFITGLLGGHSGDDIEKGRACANKLLIRVLIELESIGYELISIDGGNLRNAIARDANAVIAINSSDFERAKTIFNKIYKGVKEEYAYSDPNIVMQIVKSEAVGDQVYTENETKKLIYSLQGVAHGVITMSHSMENLVETSTNLASIKVIGDEVVVTTSQRSSIESAKRDIANTVASTFKLAGCDVIHSDGYPGWSPNPKSKLVKIASEVYAEKFSKQAKVKAIHAGLECGLILEKYPKMEAISIGPTLRGVHSPSERLEISTVTIVWEYLQELLKRLSLATKTL